MHISAIYNINQQYIVFDTESVLYSQCDKCVLFYSVIRELEDRISELEDEGRQQTDSLRRQVGETELIREREDRLKQELQVRTRRCFI